jgi:hypothetical protein
MVTPNVFLSRNHHHFPRYGTVAELYGEDWSIVTVAYRDKSTRDAIFMGTAFGGTITWNVSASAIREIGALITGLDRRILIGIALLAVLVLLHPGSRRWLMSHASKTGRLAHQAAQTSVFRPRPQDDLSAEGPVDEHLVDAEQDQPWDHPDERREERARRRRRVPHGQATPEA